MKRSAGRTRARSLFSVSQGLDQLFQGGERLFNRAALLVGELAKGVQESVGALVSDLLPKGSARFGGGEMHDAGIGLIWCASDKLGGFQMPDNARQHGRIESLVCREFRET